MKEALTFYLPLERNATTPPEATLIVRRTAENQWTAGLAVCSQDDQFRKIRGRGLAGSRLRRLQFVADSVDGLVGDLLTHLHNLNHRRPFTISVATVQDLDHHLAPRLGKMRVT